MIKPKALKIGDTIGLIAPSSPVGNPLVVENSIKVLESQGFQVIAGNSCYERYGYLSGSDFCRAEDINSMFNNSKIAGIFCIRGGYGTPRILDRLDFELIHRNPKVFLGYSDITAIHIALNQLCDLITFHGPMPSSDMLKDFDDFSYDSYITNLTSLSSQTHLINPEGIPIMSLSPGKAYGKIIGGNLSLMTSTLGTPYEIDTSGKLLLIEEIEEYTYRVDRMLTQLRLANKFEDCSGIILGNFNNCVPQYEGIDLSLGQVIRDILLPTNKPIISNLMIGHCTPKITIPLGVNAILDGDNSSLTLMECSLT